MTALYLPRNPTVVSFRQLEEVDAKAPTAGPTAPVSSLPGTKLPLFTYACKTQPKHQVLRTRSEESPALVPDIDSPSGSSTDIPDFFDGDDANSVPELGIVPQNSLMDTVLLALWEDCADQGLFRYDVTACPTKVLPGVYGFIAQLNEGRATKKRPTEFRVDQVCQPFDHDKFNFNKAMVREVLFQFGPSSDGKAHLVESAVAPASPHLVLINVSPIEYGHVLLVPKVADCLQQLVDPSTMLLGLHFAQEADNPYFRVGYNSLGAYATINHLHFQAYYLAAPFPCERAPTAPIKGLKRKRANVHISRLVDFPVNGFVIEVGDSLEEMAALVGEACLKLQEHNVPHNLLISDRGTRVFLWPQCYAERQAKGLVPQELLDTGVNPAVFEIAGHMVLKRQEDYDNMSQELAWRMLAEVSLPEERFQQVALMCFG